MPRLNPDINGWINQDGELRPVSNYMHYADRRAGEFIRVSTPERRQTCLGLEVSREASAAARETAMRVVRWARKCDTGIMAVVDGTYVECWPSDRPTELNKAIAGK